jgi:16S rRNA (cytidine1402-2'-O)-methyltransferase
VSAKLYLVAVPIGNDKDFTIRAIETLLSVDVIIGEEYSTTEKILKKAKQLYERQNIQKNDGITLTKQEILILNEHNQSIEDENIFTYLVKNNLSAALISEAGTPCFADPGASLVNLFVSKRLRVIPIPGVSSLMATIMVSGINIETSGFRYFGFLSQKTEERQKQLKMLSSERVPVVLLETPYRMKVLLRDIQINCGDCRNIVFAYKLTYPDEFIIRDTISKVIQVTADLKKGEFAIVLLPK